MADWISIYTSLSRSIEATRLRTLPFLSVQKGMDNVLRSIESSILARPPQMDSIMEQMQLTRPQRLLVAATKPQPIDLA
jgi:hypothetical protein